MNRLYLIGGGGHCKAAIDVIETERRFEIAGIFQPKEAGLEPVLGYPILGDDADLRALLPTDVSLLITVGQLKTPEVRRSLFDKFSQWGATFASVVSPKAHVSRHAHVGVGTLIMHSSIVNAMGRVGCNCIVNTLALIEHDAEIGDHTHISTGARINGGVKVGSGCFIGSGAVVREGVRIGANCVVGAGCVIKRDVEAGSVVKQ